MTGIGPVKPVGKPGTSTSGKPNQGNGKSNTKKQPPKKLNSVWDVARRNIKGWANNEAQQFKEHPFLKTGAYLSGAAGFIPGSVGTAAAGLESYLNTKAQGGTEFEARRNGALTSAATLGIGKLANVGGKALAKTKVGKTVADKVDQVLNEMKAGANSILNPPRLVTEGIHYTPNPTINKVKQPIRGEGTNHSIVSRVEEGKTFKKGDTYKAYDTDSRTFKDQKMSKELADNLNDRVKLQKEEGNIPIYSNTGTIYGIPEDVKYADDLINDVNLTEKQQNAHNLNVMNLSYGYDPSIAESALLSNLNNKAALNAYRMPYGESLPISDIYNHYSYEPVKTVKRGIVGSRAGDNLNMGGTGAIYLTDDATTLKGFPYRNEFIGPSKESFIQPYEMGVNDLDPVTSARLKELESGYGRHYDPKEISEFLLEQPYTKENPKIGILQEGAFEANVENAFNRILRQGGYAGYQDTHPIWEGRTLEPFQEYGLLRPEDLFHTGTFQIGDKIPKELRR